MERKQEFMPIKEVKEKRRNLEKKFLRYQEAEHVYSIQHKKLFERILPGTIISLQTPVYQTFRLFQCCKKSNKGIPDMSTKTTIKFVSLIRFLNTKIEIFCYSYFFCIK